MYKCPDNIIEKSMFGDVEICNSPKLTMFERISKEGKQRIN